MHQAAMEAELIGLDERISAAAVEGDAEEFVKLQMRQRALPRLIREEAARPIHAAIRRLEGEMAELVEEERAVRESPLPEVPRGMRVVQTPAMLRNRQLADVRARQDLVARELDQRSCELTRIEVERPRTLHG